MKAMKFRVRDEEHSAQIQEYLYSEGYRWGSTNMQLPRHTHQKYLFANADGTIAHGMSDGYFEKDENVECELEISFVCKEVQKISVAGVEGKFSRQQVEALARAAGLIS